MSRGDWYRYDAKKAVEHCRELDVRELKLRAGSCINVVYSAGTDGGGDLTI